MKNKPPILPAATNLEVSWPVPKNALKSKTILGLIIFFLPAVLAQFGINMAEVSEGSAELTKSLGVILTVLGLRTAEQPLALPKILGGYGAASPLLAMMMTGVFGLVALSSLTSCSSVSGNVLLRDPETGAKGGLDFDGSGSVYPILKMPIRDASGKVVGEVDLRSGK